MRDFLDEKRREINDRLTELRPIVDEFERLQAAADALGGISGASETSARRTTARRAGTAGRSPRHTNTNASGRRRGRPRGSGTRGTEALQLVKAAPGITIQEIAQKMGIKENYLYRVLNNLAEDGLVTKQGRGWHLKDAEVAAPVNQ